MQGCYFSCRYQRGKLVGTGGSNKDAKFIEVGYLYLTSAVLDDSQGFIWFDCTDHINYDKDHKIWFEKGGEQFWDKLTGSHNINIAQIYNNLTKEFLHKDSNITYRTKIRPMLLYYVLFSCKKEEEISSKAIQ